MDKILTIIIPTYNMEKYLRHCLDSLIVPNMDKVEVLVINDGSKDSSSAIGHEYQDKYPQTFRVIDKENGNYGSCVNRGLKEATGKYVKVLDADDSFDTTNFQKYIDTISKLDVDLILSDTILVNEEYKQTDYWRVNAPIETIFKFQESPAYVQMHCIAYKTVNLKNIGYSQTEGISYTDQEWTFWPMSTVRSAYYIAIPLYKYLMGREGQTMDPKIFAKAVPQEMKVLDRMISLWELHHEEWILSRTYMNNKVKGLYLNLFNKAIRYGLTENKEAFIIYDKSIRKKYPAFYKFSNKFLMGTKIRFPYVWYFRNFHTIKPFEFLFKLKEWHNQD